MPEAFPDRSDRLFGREAAIGALLARAGGKGITVVTGRARMGKTWTIQETARRLIESGYLVGYHEAAGGGSHALYAVSDLYTRWFTASSFKDHAVTLWEQHKDDVIGRVGQVGNRGIIKGEQGDSVGAIADFTAAIELPGAPPIHVALALCCRGTVKDQRSDASGAIAEFSAAIELPGASPELVAIARESQSELQRRSGVGEDSSLQP